MKKALSIWLLSIYVFSFTEFHHLLKLPILVEHFIEHRELTNEITFVEFLVLHYTTETTHDDHDMQLPFKDFGHCVAVQTMVVPSCKIELNDELQLNHKIAYVIFYKKFIPASYLSEIWQPPKA
jgi:hypothetical protein